MASTERTVGTRGSSSLITPSGIASRARSIKNGHELSSRVAIARALQAKGREVSSSVDDGTDDSGVKKLYEGAGAVFVGSLVESFANSGDWWDGKEFVKIFNKAKSEDIPGITEEMLVRQAKPSSSDHRFGEKHGKYLEKFDRSLIDKLPDGVQGFLDNQPPLREAVGQSLKVFQQAVAIVRK